MFKCKKCGQETGVFVQDVNDNYVCKECYLKQQKELGLTAEKELSTADKLLWLVKNKVINSEPNRYIAVLTNTWNYFYFDNNDKFKDSEIIKYCNTVEQAINAAYDFAKEGK